MKKPSRAYLLFALLAVVYLGLVIFLPANATTLTRYNLSAAHARNLNLGVALPYIVIWFVAFFGYIKLKNYSQIIIKSVDGKALSRISDGLLVLAIGLPVSAILSRILGYIGRSQAHLLPTTTIASIYIDLLIGLLATTIIFIGAKHLVDTVNNKIKTEPSYAVMISLALVGTPFIYLTLTNPVRQFPSEELGRAAYYLPDALIVITVILPLLVAWYMGLTAVYYILAYRKYVKGVIYRSALGFLASGLVFIILARIAIRYLTSLNTVISQWSLNYLLIAVYILLVLIAIGFMLIAKGTKKLKMIEEV